MSGDESRLRIGALISVLVMFFASGASGLIYEVVWTRMLTLVFGGTTFAISAVLTSFMFGLGVGSLLGGRFADRMTHRRTLLISYGLLEIAIAGLAVATPFLFSVLDAVHIAVVSNSELSRFLIVLLRFGLSLLGILLPTSLMGATLPILSRYLVTRAEHTGLRIGVLYSINTAGAVAGCLLSGFYLIEGFGVSATLCIAAALNLAAGFAALILARGDGLEDAIPPRDVAVSSQKTTADPEGVRLVAAPILVAIAMLSGFTSLAYQVLWARDFATLFVNTVYGFTVVVGTFLIGLVLGGMVASAIADRIRNGLAGLAIVQILIGVTAIFLIDFGTRSSIASVIASLIGYKDMDGWSEFLTIRFMIASVTMLPTAALIGATFPLLIRIYAGYQPRLGSKVGELYFANTVGCVLGSSVAGFVMIPLLGVNHSVVAIGTTSVVAGILLTLVDPLANFQRRLVLVGSSVAMATVAIVRLDTGRVETAFPDAQILLALESIDGHVQIEQLPNSSVQALTVNYSRRLGSDSPSALRLQRRQGHLPVLLHPHPKDVLVIGFATGTTSGAVSLHQGVESIDGVEIVACLEQTASYSADSNNDVINDPRFQFHADDGRNFVRASSKKYDVIIVDLFQAHDAGVGNLYSLDHFKNCRRQLKPGGLICQWIPTDQLPPVSLRTLLATFLRVFPNSTLWMADVPDLKGIVGIVGSEEPLRFDIEGLRARFGDESLANAMAKEYLEDEYSVLSSFLLGSSDIQRLSNGAPLNTDDRPRIEFLTPRLLGQQKLFGPINFAGVTGGNGEQGGYENSHTTLISEHASNWNDENNDRLITRVEAKSQIIRGLLLAAQRKFDEAVACLQAAQSICPTSREVRELAIQQLQRTQSTRSSTPPPSRRR